MKERIKTVFLGSPEFAIPSLGGLLDDNRFEVVAVITQPDKPSGRGMSLTPPPVKRFALDKRLAVWQPEKLKDIKEELLKAQPDFLVVVAYGKIVPKSILSIPKHGCVNVHGSILPRYRGASVLQAPILNGDEETGATIMLMDEGLDTGPILKIVRMPLQGTETLEDVHDTLSKLGAEELPQTLVDFMEGRISPEPQKGPSTYVRETKKEDGLIDWSKSAVEIERMIRAYTPWPGAFCKWSVGDGRSTKILKILAAKDEILPTDKHKTGETFLMDGRLAVRCGQGALIVIKLQLEGGKPLPADDFLRGHADFIGKTLS